MSNDVASQFAGVLPAETAKDLPRVGPAAAAHPGESRTIEATVFAVIPEFHQVHVQSSDGHHYAITAVTPGVDWTRLFEGQRLECMVTTVLPRVLVARVLT